MMNNIPKIRFKEFTDEWQEKKLGDVLSCVVDNRGKTPGLSEQGIPLIEVNAMGGKNIDYGAINKYVDDETYCKWFRKHISSGDILFSTVGRTAMCSVYDGTKKAAIAQNIVGLRTDRGSSKHFLYYLLIQPHNNHKFKKIEMIAVQPSVKVSQMIHLKFNFPIELEQEKIAGVLTVMDEKINKLEEKKKGFEKYKKGVMQAIFSQKIRFKKSNGSNFPDWEEKKLGKICKITTGKLDANAMIPNGEYRFYTCAKDFYKIDKYAFDTEALLVSGNGANVGYIHYYKGKFNAYQRTYVLDKFVENIFYIKYALQKDLSQRIQVEKKEGNTPYIVLGTLAEMKIMSPSKEEQEKIAEFLTSLDNKVELINMELKQAKLFKKSLLQQMFV